MAAQAGLSSTTSSARAATLVRRLFGIHPGEGRLVALLFAFFLVVTATYWIQKPIRTAKLLTSVGVEFLPFVKFASALLILPVVLVYTILLRRFSRKLVLIGCVALFLLGSIVFAIQFSSARPADWVHYAYFFYVDAYITVMVTMFWSVANERIRPDQARRLYGFIGAGGILGGVAGSAVTGWAGQALGAPGLLLVCALTLAAIAPVSLSSVRITSKPASTPASESRPKHSLQDAIGGALATMRERYLRTIVVLIACYEVVSSIVDYQFSAAAAASFAGEHELTAYMGQIGFAASLAALVFQVVLTTWILRRYGPRVGLLILPIILGIGSLIYLACPALTIATGLFSSDGSLSYSVNQTSKEVLYTPLDEATKIEAKAFIDMFIYRVAKGVGAVLLYVGNTWLVPLGWQAHHFGLLSVLVIFVWVTVAAYAGYGFARRTEHREVRATTA